MLTSSEETEHFFDHPYYKWNKILFKLTGFWPYQNYRVRVTIAFLIIIVSTMSVVAPEIVLFVKKFGNMSKMMKLLPGFFVTYMVFVVIFNVFINSNKFRDILDQIKINKSTLSNEEEAQIFNKYAELGEFWTRAYTMFLSTAIVILPIGPLSPIILDFIVPLNHSRPLKLMLEADYLVDMQEKTNFLLIFAHQMQGVISNVGVAIAFDTYYVMIMHHACSLFAILSYKIKTLDKLHSSLLSNKISNQEKDKLLLMKIRECVRYHLTSISFFDTIEESLCICWFMQVFSNMMVISIIGVQMMFRSDGDENSMLFIASSAFNAMGTLVRLYWICWPAQKLVNHSSDINDILYEISWYEFPLKSKKAVLFMILNSSNPCTLTAGKMILLNMESFSRLANMSYTYFTMLLSF